MNRERRISITKNRLSMYRYASIISQGKMNETAGDRAYPMRRNWSAGSNAFIDPERNPSRSSVTNLKPSCLKIAVNCASHGGIQGAAQFFA